jgi:hypothetical protein
VRIKFDGYSPLLRRLGATDKFTASGRSAAKRNKRNGTESSLRCPKHRDPCHSANQVRFRFDHAMVACVSDPGFTSEGFCLSAACAVFDSAYAA